MTQILVVDKELMDDAEATEAVIGTAEEEVELRIAVSAGDEDEGFPPEANKRFIRSNCSFKAMFSELIFCKASFFSATSTDNFSTCCWSCSR